MKMKLLGAMATTALLLCVACDDNTSNIGVVDNGDNINVAQAAFEVATRSIKADSVLAKTSTCYLGRVTDPETNSSITSDFLAQFHVLDNYQFPARDSIVKDKNGDFAVDSVELRLYLSSYYGDSLNAMKMSVYELDTTNVLNEQTSYYSNIDPLTFVNHLKKTPVAKKVFSVVDLTVSDSLRELSTYYRNVRIILPKSYGQFIVNKYFENPSYFKNSYNFIRHVVPGFYFHTEQGNGTMIYVDVSSFNLYFRYVHDDSTYVGVTRFAATGEVLQNTKIANGNIDQLLPPNETSCTYLKTPAGIFTEATLPIDDIYKNHETDSINTAKIIFTRCNNSAQRDYNLSIPKTLLMMRKSDLYSFFENSSVPDGKTSFSATFAATYANTYTFTNIANLVAYCKNERNYGAVSEGLTTAQWEAKHPDWNKVVLVPVVNTVNSSSVIVKTVHDLSLASTRLVGGDTKLSIQIVYSKFDK
jgi:hypothetical protein